MKQRLEQFLELENISKAQFADSIDVARAVISHIMSGRNKPSYEFIVNTMETYPQLNIEWLLSGKGEMYRDGRVDGKDAVLQRSRNLKSNGRRIIVLNDDGTYEEFC